MHIINMVEKSMTNNNLETNFSCPMPLTNYDQINLSHSSGGLLSNNLIKKFFIESFCNKYLDDEHDGAIIELGNKKLAFTTDSFVIDPIFFPGGNIGELAVFGTVNDLAMCGAKPLFLSLALIIEEGLSTQELWEITQSIKKAADQCKIQIVTGDTKVVEKGKGDKIFINTAGIGEVFENSNIHYKNIKPGDKIILSGTIAEHGIAILTKRLNFEFNSNITSDLFPLNHIIEELFINNFNIKCLRDPTRGGISATLNELSKKSNLGFNIYEDKIPIKENIRAACELLGIDPLYVANEGKFIAIVEEKEAENVLNCIRNQKAGENAEIIGEVTEEHNMVVLKNSFGSGRIIDLPLGEQFPRIC